MHSIKLNVIIIGMVLLLVALAILSYMRATTGVATGVSLLEVSSQPHLVSVKANKAESDVIDDPAVSNPAVESNLPERYRLTLSEEAEAKAWVTKMGGMSKLNTEYAQYNVETLKKLAQAGDPEAIDALGTYYLKESGPDAAKRFYFDSAVKGVTHVFTHLAKLESYYKYGSVSSDEEKKLSAIEVLALYNVAKLRGNRWPNITGADFFISVNGIQLSIDDQQAIESRSQEIYDQLQQKRVELGLGAFDNSVPESVKKYFDRFEYLNSTTKKK